MIKNHIVALYSLSIFLLMGGFSLAQEQNISQGNFFEGEPFIAINPNNDQHLVIAWMGFLFGQEIVIKSKVSFDGGSTWGNLVNHPHVLSGNRSADPSLSFDNSGNVYLCYIDFDAENFLNGQVVISKSTDGGLLWSPPVEAISITDCPDQLCIDRPWMVIDRSGSPTDGTIYVTSMNADQPLIVTPPYHPYLAVSTDTGVSFSTPRLLDTLGYLVGNDITKPMPTPSIAADGTILAIYPSYLTTQSFLVQLIMAKSIDQGVDVDHSIVLQSSSGVSDPFAKLAAKLFADPSDASHLMYIFLDQQNGDLDVNYIESFDQGDSWTNPQRINDDQIGNGVMQDMIWGTFNDNGDAIVTWRDRRSVGSAGYDNDSRIMAAVKRNDSSSFSANFSISSVASYDPILEGSGNDFQCVEFIGDTIHATWGDTRIGILNIYYNKLVYDETVVSVESHIIATEGSADHIYPNPATHVVYYPKEYVGSQFSLYDSQMRCIKRGMHKEKGAIDITAFPEGQYYLIFEVKKGGQHLFQFIK